MIEHSAAVVLQMLAACAEAALTLVPINPNLHRTELAAFIAHSNPSLVVALDERLTPVREIMARRAQPELHLEENPPASPLSHTTSG